jgi:hypothetical protein
MFLVGFQQASGIHQRNKNILEQADKTDMYQSTQSHIHVHIHEKLTDYLNIFFFCNPVICNLY